jgi:hypothetical protein
MHASASAGLEKSFIPGDNGPALCSCLSHQLAVAAFLRIGNILAHQPQPPSQAHEHQIHQKAISFHSPTLASATIYRLISTLQL